VTYYAFCLDAVPRAFAFVVNASIRHSRARTCLARCFATGCLPPVWCVSALQPSPHYLTTSAFDLQTLRYLVRRLCHAAVLDVAAIPSRLAVVCVAYDSCVWIAPLTSLDITRVFFCASSALATARRFSSITLLHFSAHTRVCGLYAVLYTAPLSCLKPFWSALPGIPAVNRLLRTVTLRSAAGRSAVCAFEQAYQRGTQLSLCIRLTMLRTFCFLWV